MLRRLGTGLVLVAAVLVTGTDVVSQRQAPAAEQAEPAAPAVAPSPRNANYSIDVELDPASRTVTGRSVVSWRNISGRPTSELQFHLYWNAWRNTDSTWMRERLRAGRGPGGRYDDSPARRPAGDWSYIDITAIRLLAGGAAPLTDLTASGTFIAPDDGNRADQTVLSVPLPGAGGAGRVGDGGAGVDGARAAHVRADRRGGQLLLHRAVVPQARRAGRHGLEHAPVPRRHRVLRRLRRVRRANHRAARLGGGRDRARARAARHAKRHDDASLCAGRRPRFRVDHQPRLRREDGDLRAPAACRAPSCACCCSPSTSVRPSGTSPRREAALKYYGEWFGPYPYGHLTIVDPAWQSSAGGMEYPTLFTAGTRWLAPAHVGDPEDVTIHEAGHQFWYGLVGNNEFEHAWMDEGLNQFSTSRALHEAFTPIHFYERFFGGFIPWVFREARGDARRQRRAGRLSVGGGKRRAGHPVVAVLHRHGRRRSPTTRPRSGCTRSSATSGGRGCARACRCSSRGRSSSIRSPRICLRRCRREPGAT